MTYGFEDINYKDASKADQEDMFHAYSQLLNSMEAGTTIKLTINNRKLNKEDFREHMLMEEKQDNLNIYRKEYNQILMDKATGASSMIQEKYFTVSIFARDRLEAERSFQRIYVPLSTQLGRMGSKCVPMDAFSRMQVFHDFFRPEEEAFQFDMEEMSKGGQDFRDKICPESYENERDYKVLSGLGCYT